MEWLKRLNEAVNYMEENLTGEIELDQAAQIACCSSFHFQRMFSYIAEIPLSEYIRRRKMTRAAFDLQSGEEKVIDIALKYGYDSPTAFNRAFQSVHGVAPSAARKQGVVLKAYPPICFQISIKGDEEMKYRIVKKEAFKIVGVKEHYEVSIDENFAQIPLFWQKAAQSGVIPELCKLMRGGEPAGILGVSTCMNGKDFDYYIAVTTDLEPTDGLESYPVPECTWAVFECIGAMPTAIQNLQKRIISEWLPTSGYEYADAPDIEAYEDGDQTAEEYRCEVWLPIVKK